MLNYCRTSGLSHAVASQKEQGGDDRIAVRLLADGSTLLALADGATGMGYGYLAAEAFIDVCLAQIQGFPVENDTLSTVFAISEGLISRLARECDTTGILCVVRGADYVLASVGDSGAWSLHQGQLVELTAGQRRKPRIGSGSLQPSIRRGTLPGPLVLASDGLPHALPLAMLAGPLGLAANAEMIIALAQQNNPNGLPDDLGVIVYYPEAP